MSKCCCSWLIKSAASLLHQHVCTCPESNITKVLAYQTDNLNTIRSEPSSLNLSSKITSWSSLLSSVFFWIFLRKFGSTPEFAGENSPSVSLLSSSESFGPGELLQELEPLWLPWIFMAFLFRLSPEGLLGLECFDEDTSSCIIIPEMAEISSRELRTLLRGGEDIYQVKKVLSQGFPVHTIF